MLRKILIVDDIESNRLILKEMLHKDYEILEAASGEEALDVLTCKHEFISAVLLDIGMPGIDGFEVLRIIRSTNILSSLPVIMITGNEDNDTRIKALAFGANDFVMKPYSSEIIKHCLRNTITLREASATVSILERDRLTGVLSREAFFEKAAKEIERKPAGHFVLSCLDIEGFKVINDQYGSDVGDDVLKSLADSLQNLCNKYNGICGRIFADRFVSLYPCSNLKLPNIELEILEEWIQKNTEMTPRISVGRYIVEDKQLSINAMYDRAAIAKNTVKGRYDVRVAVYNEGMRSHIVHEQKIVNDMNTALEKKQFEVWFQPQYNHATGAMIGAETLVRWRHPESGIIMPDEFIPIFEKNGFIYDLDKFVWEEVCGYLRKWIDEGSTPLPVSVNISRYDILRPDLIKTIVGFVEKYHLSRDLLRLEITETAFAKSPQHIVNIVKELINIGFTVEIDDFGSGYSSLNTLKDVPAQIIKLDMKFLANSNDSQRGGNIVESVVRMAKWLGMSVIAEGVETKEQADYLRSIGCNYVQGFLYARPMPAEQYEAYRKEPIKEERLLVLETVKNLDNNSFWDPSSMDTLIFNSYVGAACIFEYRKGNIELLRATEKYAQLIGGSGMSIEDALRVNWTDYLEDEELNLLITNLTESIATRKEITDEYTFINLPNCVHKMTLRSTLRVIASAGDRYLVYCTSENITAEREAKEIIKETEMQLRFLNDMSHELLAQPDTDISIIFALKKLMEYFNGTRAYIFELDFEKAAALKTYNVTKDEVAAATDNLSNMPFTMLNFWFEAFAKEGYCAIEDVNALEDRRAAERERLLTQNITSLFIVPLKRDGKLIGMMGIDDPKHKMEHTERFAALGNYIAVILTRRDLNVQIREDNAAMSKMMSDMPGGFARIRLCENGKVEAVYVNEGMVSLTGMKREELMTLYGKDALAGVHPDDVDIVNDVIAKMIKNGEAHSSRYRLLHSNGSYIWLSIFGRVTEDISGETFLNIYYMDASEQVKVEETQRILLDNMPCGIGVYELEGEQMSLTYQNKKYWELVGLEKAEFLEAGAMSAIHPDDVPIVMGELRLAIEQKRDVVCDIRLRHWTKGYRSVRLVGNIVNKEAGKFSIYAAFIPNDISSISYQQILPVVLSAIMKSTTDFSFAKDKNFRYLTCSRAFANMVGKEKESDIIGKTDYDLFAYEMAEKFRKDDEDLFKNGKAIVDKMEEIPSGDDSPRYSSTSKYLLKDGVDEIIGLYGAGRDITKAHIQETQLKLVNDSIPGGIATYAFRENDIRIVYCNDGFCGLFGGTREGFEQRGEINPIDWVFEEDREQLIVQILDLVEKGKPIDCIYRIHVMGGGYKWISEKAVVTERRGDTVQFNAVLLDVTEQQTALERLRISEEENTLAVQHGGSVVSRYNIAERSLTTSSSIAKTYSVPEIIYNVPEEPVRMGLISQETAAAYIGFFEAIINGRKSGTVIYQHKYPGQWRWIEAKSSTIFSDDGKPVKAIISLFDVTERLEKETVYKKWLQSLEDRVPESYTLFRCNLSNNTSYDTKEGNLISFHIDDDSINFPGRVKMYATQWVHEKDRDEYIGFLNYDKMLTDYYKGKRSDSFEYRELLVDGNYRWLKLTADLVEYPTSTEVEAYLMYEDIDASKRAEVEARELSESDPLTGILNRVAFATKVNKILNEAELGTKHALLILDIDGFKQVNDVFGHIAGDKALIGIANGLRSIMRRDDLVARLGGDEYVVFLSGIPDDKSAIAKAEQICFVSRKKFSEDVKISGSVGIAIAPHDGMNFDALYKKADAALYYVKGSGKDNQAVYNSNMEEKHFKI